MKENEISLTEDVIEVQTPIIEEKKEKDLTKLDVLRKISSIGGLRDTLNDIVSGGLGALVLVSDSDSENIFQGGFKVNCKFTPRRLAELAKMDGAIILSKDFKKILYANTLLIPDTNLTTLETGTRHQAAERAAKQTKGLVITISQRTGRITLFYSNSKYILQNTEDLLRKATETLQILEKQREVFEELIANLNILEVTNLVSVGEICSIFQRIEIIRKMANIINEYIVELGRGGLIVRMRMMEITKGIEKNEDFLIRDYCEKSSKIKSFFDSLTFESVLDTKNIANYLFKKSLEEEIMPKGYRLLSKLNFEKKDIENLINNIRNLDKILNSNEDDLRIIVGEKANMFLREVEHLREQIMLGKKI